VLLNAATVVNAVYVNIGVRGDVQVPERADQRRLIVAST
jgi:hypothetical protein